MTRVTWRCWVGKRTAWHVGELGTPKPETGNPQGYRHLIGNQAGFGFLGADAYEGGGAISCPQGYMVGRPIGVAHRLLSD